MILSKYCKIYPDTDNPGNIILFSAKRASKISVPETMPEDIRQNRLSEDESGTLTELGFLVNTGVEERDEILAFIDELNAVDKTFSVQLVMNLDCNLNCGYCFEGSRKGKHYMTKDKAAEVIEFLKKAVSPETEEIKILFYGGEPLLGRDMVLYVSAAIKSFADEMGIKYTGKAVTNATLLFRETVRKLTASGIRTASVTLDGPESCHDLSRPFKGGIGSFSAILKNLKEVCGMIDIEIGGNYTKVNYFRFPELLDLLANEGLTPERVASLRFYPVIQEVEGIVNPDFNDGYTSINERWIFESEIFLREEIMKRGYRTSKIMPSTCMMDLKYRVIVNYDGSIYKCSGLIGREEFKVGDIKTGIGDYRVSHNLDNWKNEKCLDCCYLPMCFGGCRYMKFIRDGNMEGIDCRKPYLDATMEAAVTQDIRYGLIN